MTVPNYREVLQAINASQNMDELFAKIMSLYGIEYHANKAKSLRASYRPHADRLRYETNERVRALILSRDPVPLSPEEKGHITRLPNSTGVTLANYDSVPDYIMECGIVNNYCWPRKYMKGLNCMDFGQKCAIIKGVVYPVAGRWVYETFTAGLPPRNYMKATNRDGLWRGPFTVEVDQTALCRALEAISQMSLLDVKNTLWSAMETSERRRYDSRAPPSIPRLVTDPEQNEDS